MHYHCNETYANQQTDADLNSFEQIKTDLGRIGQI